MSIQDSFKCVHGLITKILMVPEVETSRAPAPLCVCQHLHSHTFRIPIYIDFSTFLYSLIKLEKPECSSIQQLARHSETNNNSIKCHTKNVTQYKNVRIEIDTPRL